MHGMTPEKWRRLVAITEVVLELESSLRQVYLFSIGRDDPQLEKDARALLQHFGAPVGDDEATEPGAVGQASAERIGPYRVLELLGQGGMGAVFLAEQKEEGLARQVAVKVLHDRYGVTLARDRFLAERQILAHLEHPNIARMLDAGTTADGRPYLVIEVVDGEPIDRYCDRHQLGLRERIKLFRKVCQAVSYAHRNLVVHRDLKPSNILVTPDGEPKLLDFGIAKILSRDVFDSVDPDLTRSHERPMTPSYASPEQIRGLPITTATDVYALGTLLYKLLAGALPYSYPAGTPEVMQAIQDSGLAPPSAVLEAGDGPESQALAREVKGDLDNIILTALGKKDDEKYASVDELDSDLRRFLVGEPVHVTGGRWTYRARKFIGRHRWPVALAALLVLSIFIGLTVAIGQTRQILAEKEKVESERDRAEAISTFLTDLFVGEGPDEDLRRQATVQELIDDASKRIEEGLDASPTTRVQLMFVLGNTYERLGMFQRARELYEQTLDLRQELGLQTDKQEMDTRRLLASVLLQGDEQDLERAARLNEQTRSWGAENGDTELQINSLSGLARIVSRAQSDPGQGLDYMLEAKRLADSDPEVSDRVRAAVYSTLGTHYLQGFKMAEALPYLQESLRLKEKIFGPDSPELTSALNNLASAHGFLGRNSEAAEIYKRALDIGQRFHGKNSAKNGIFMVNLATYLLRADETESALKYYDEAIAVFEEVSGPESFDVGWGEQMRGFARQHVGDLEGARESLQRATAIYRKLHGDDHPRLQSTLPPLAQVELALGRPELALKLADESLAVGRQAPKTSLAPMREADTLLTVAEALSALGRDGEAKERYREAARIAEKNQVEPVKSQMQTLQVVSLLRLGEADKAEPLIEELEAAGHRDRRFRLLCTPQRSPACDSVEGLLPESVP